ncbi:MAG: response regulator transcription factor [Planctomycetota bacterium]
MHVLIVEDDRRFASFLKKALQEDGHDAQCAYDGEAGLFQATSGSFDLAVLDLMLPKKDGFQVLREIRERRLQLPVLVLTARSSVEDRVRGLDLGADDYLPKPFALEEFRARVRALLRRGREGTPSVLEFADLRMDLISRQVSRGARKIELTPRESALLEFLLRNAGKPVSRTAIAEKVWNYHFDWESNVIDVFVRNLREKIERAGEPKLIHTVRGVGYSIRDPGAV